MVCLMGTLRSVRLLLRPMFPRGGFGPLAIFTEEPLEQIPNRKTPLEPLSHLFTWIVLVLLGLYLWHHL